MLSLSFFLCLRAVLAPGRGVDVPMKLLFGAGQQPLDVAPVAPDHKAAIAADRTVYSQLWPSRKNTDTGMLAVAATEPRDT